jgi:hypothetical protein
MATRFYLPSTGAAAVSPGFDSSWELTSQADRVAMVTTKIASVMTDKQVDKTDATATIDMLVRQYVSDVIDAQTISGNVKGQIRVMQTVSGGSDHYAQMLLKVVSGDGSVVRGTLLAHNVAAISSEFVLSMTNRRFPRGGSTALTNVVASAGDRIVAEIGYRGNNALTNRSSIFSLGDDSGTDLPEDETTTAANNAWIEFSNTIAFGGGGGGGVPLPVFLNHYKQQGIAA